MNRIIHRSVRRALAVALPALVLSACADESAVTAPGLPRAPQLGIGPTVIVTNTSGGTSQGSLRWAVANAGAYGTVRFDPSVAGKTITLDSTLHIRGVDLIIEGPADKGITLSGGGKRRVMEIDEGAKLVNVTVRDGADSIMAAGILATGNLILENTTVWRNSAPNAAGIYLAGAGTFTNSTIADNSATGIGSGLSFTNFSAVTLINTTLNGNGPAPAVSSHYRGSYTPVVVLRNSIVAGNTQGCNASTGFAYEGMNLSYDTTCGTSPRMLVTDAKLDRFGDNGGPTPTTSLRADSPAVNGGADCSVTVDQRYVSRDATCDIGAFEFTGTRRGKGGRP